MSEFLIVLLIITVIIDVRKSLINNYKIGYYEHKLKDNGYYISHIENITLREILMR